VRGVAVAAGVGTSVAVLVATTVPSGVSVAVDVAVTRTSTVEVSVTVAVDGYGSSMMPPVEGPVAVAFEQPTVAIAITRIAMKTNTSFFIFSTSYFYFMAEANFFRTFSLPLIIAYTYKKVKWGGGGFLRSKNPPKTK